jgi:hypothetical protein
MNLPGPEPFFDRERLRVYSRLIVFIYIVAASALVVTSTAMIDRFAKPLGYDFITFWAASHLTLAGEAAAAFDTHRIFAAEQAAVPANTSIFLWHYPPTYQLLVMPLALLPYIAAFLVFVGATLLAYVLVLRRFIDERIADSREAVMLLLAFPGTFICVFHGQNALLSAVLFGAAILAAERGRIWCAGLALGCLAYKPQLGVLIPIALVASGQWRLFFAIGASALGFVAISTLVLGPDLWLVFIRNMPLVREIMEAGFLPWHKMPSAFVFFRYLGVSEPIAYGAQLLTMVGAAASVALVWSRCGVTRISWAVLIAATLLVPPYTFDYELAIAGLALALLASEMARRGASRREKAALVFIFAAPALLAPVAQATHVQIGYPALLLLLALCVRQAYSAGAFADRPKTTPRFSVPSEASNASTTATTPATSASAMP